MKARWVILPLLAVSSFVSPVRAQYAERGATVGGIGGALAGAAIGRHNGDTAVGALVGGAVGLITGAAIGGAKDDAVRRDAIANQRAYVYSKAVSAHDVVSMSQSGVGEEVIINHIRENGVQRRPEVADVIALHRQGVSERVITAMQAAPEGGRMPAPPPPTTVYRTSPVVVEEHYYVRPSYWHCPPPPAYYHHHHHYYRPAPHVHWGVTFGN